MNFVSLHTPSLLADHIIVQPPTQGGWPPSATTLRSSFHSVWLLLCAPYLWARLFISAPYLWARKGEALICGHAPAAEMQMMVVSTFFLLPVVATIFPLSDFQTNPLLLILSLLHFPFQSHQAKGGQKHVTTCLENMLSLLWIFYQIPKQK